ncbi:hypothetical protein EVAR_82042_1 [Eumeta japonica]|uniref:Uncharacterized protein n=1 Tax=Eumeta variegata TaxID=151549 RepID=A0A4C1XL13_EUMVA|nr:hypothetical protein EVAR_82042_1 [Eumeta japonica]
MEYFFFANPFRKRAKSPLSALRLPKTFEGLMSDRHQLRDMPSSTSSRKKPSNRHVKLNLMKASLPTRANRTHGDGLGGRASMG